MRFEFKQNDTLESRDHRNRGRRVLVHYVDDEVVVLKTLATGRFSCVHPGKIGEDYKPVAGDLDTVAPTVIESPQATPVPAPPEISRSTWGPPLTRAPYFGEHEIERVWKLWANAEMLYRAEPQWFPVCVCGWNSENEELFPTKEKAWEAGVAHVKGAIS